MKKKGTSLILIWLIVSTAVVYSRILWNGFINLDDPLYITKNNFIKSGIHWENIKWACTSEFASNWHPLTLLSHTLDWSLFGANASGHHLISILLHIGSTLLLFLFFNRTTKNSWVSAFVASIFALHPLRVESVAWAAERKDVLSMFFGLAALYVYALYVETTRFSRYMLCLMLFVLSLAAKPMLVTLPFVFLLLDYWPLRRWQKQIQPMDIATTIYNQSETVKDNDGGAGPVIVRREPSPVKTLVPLTGRLLWEKIPFVVFTIISSILTLWAQRVGGAMIPIEFLSRSARLANAVNSYVGYLGKTFWPVDLAVLYPFHKLPLWQILSCCLLLVAITCAVLYLRKRAPFLLVGWFWYLGTMVPVLGLVQVGVQAMADRYTYFPTIGIVIMLAWGIPLFHTGIKIQRKVLFPLGTAVLIISAILTWRQCGYWKNSIELYSHTLQVTKNNQLIHNNFGLALFEEGQVEKAIEQYNQAVRIRVSDYMAYVNRGNAYAKLNQYQNALQDYNEAIRFNPDNAEAYYSRGTVYGKHGEYQHAIDDFNKAIDLRSNYVTAYSNRGICYRQLGQYQLAINDFDRAIDLQKDYADAYNNRAIVYFDQGENKLGCRDAKKACELGNCKAYTETKEYCR